MTDSETGDDQSNSVTVNELEYAANNTPVPRGHALALAVALSDDELTAEEAAEGFEVLKTNGKREFVADYYPGDDAYDRADLRYGGIY